MQLIFIDEAPIIIQPLNCNHQSTVTVKYMYINNYSYKI